MLPQLFKLWCNVVLKTLNYSLVHILMMWLCFLTLGLIICTTYFKLCLDLTNMVSWWKSLSACGAASHLNFLAILLEKDNYRFQKQEFTHFYRMFDLTQRSSYEVSLDSGCYRKFVPFFADLCVSLNHALTITQPDIIVWSTTMTESFHSIISNICQQNI